MGAIDKAWEDHLREVVDQSDGAAVRMQELAFYIGASTVLSRLASISTREETFAALAEMETDITLYRLKIGDESVIQVAGPEQEQALKDAAANRRIKFSAQARADMEEAGITEEQVISDILGKKH